MKTAISIPDVIFEAAEKIARRLGVSRSQLYTTAVSDFIREHQNDGVTEKLNEIYTNEPSNLDPISHTLQYASLEKNEW
jgi:metal-responsive CopG/Arc/MetJ family transcriptional regulator